MTVCPAALLFVYRFPPLPFNMNTDRFPASEENVHELEMLPVFSQRRLPCRSPDYRPYVQKARRATRVDNCTVDS